MDRNDLLRDQIQENKDPQMILVSTWHPKLSTIPSILKNNFLLISNDLKLSKILSRKLLSPTEKTNRFLIIF